MPTHMAISIVIKNELKILLDLFAELAAIYSRPGMASSSGFNINKLANAIEISALLNHKINFIVSQPMRLVLVRNTNVWEQFHIEFTIAVAFLCAAIYDRWPFLLCTLLQWRVLYEEAKNARLLLLFGSIFPFDGGSNAFSISFRR